MHLKKYLKSWFLIFLETLNYILMYIQNEFELNREIIIWDRIFIILRKPLGYGDLLMLSPLILKIEEKFNRKNIFIVTEYEKFFESDAIWVKPSKKSFSIHKNDLVIFPTFSLRNLKYFFNNSFKVGYPLSSSFFSNFRNKIPPFSKYDAVGEHYFYRSRNLIDALNLSDSEPRYPKTLSEDFQVTSKRFVTIAPYSNWQERGYSLDSFHYIIEELSKFIHIVIIGLHRETPLDLSFSSHKIINLTNKTTIKEANSIISNSALYIGNDSGLTHFAFLSKRPVISIFGCVDFFKRIPLSIDLNKNKFNFTNSNKCSFFSCYDGYNKPTCINDKKFICLDVNPNLIINRAIKILNVNV